MSIKLYNAFRARLPFATLHARLSAVREQVGAQAETLQLAALARRFEAQLDGQIVASLFDRTGTQGFDMAWFWPVLDEVKEKLEKVRAKQVREPGVDFSCSVLILPAGPEEFLGVVYSEQPDLIETVLATEGFEDWHYQTSTDRPESVSEAEWAQRRMSWAAATRGFSGAMGDHGFVYEFVAVAPPYPSPEALAAHWSSSPARAERVAREAVLLEIARTLEAEQRAAGQEPDLLRCVMRATTRVAAPDAAARVAYWARQVEPHIVPLGRV